MHSSIDVTFQKPTQPRLEEASSCWPLATVGAEWMEGSLCLRGTVHCHEGGCLTQGRTFVTPKVFTFHSMYVVPQKEKKQMNIEPSVMTCMVKCSGVNSSEVCRLL